MNTLTVTNNRKRVAIISHHHKRTELINWSYQHRKLLRQFELYAPSPTAAILEGTTGGFVHKVKDLQGGGDQELENMVKEGKIDLMVFIWDPLMGTTYDGKIPGLMACATQENIPVACNISTANLVLTALNPKNQQQEARNPVILRKSRGGDAMRTEMLNVVTKN